MATSFGKRVILAALLIVAVPSVFAQERLDLTTTTTYIISNYAIDILHFEPRAGRIYVRLVSNVPSEPPVEKVYDGTTSPTGAFLMHALNTTDLSVKSLERRVLERLAQDVPALSGTVSGTPR